MRNYIRILRHQKEKSQLEIAKAIGISQQMYSAIENGTRQKNISLPLLERLAEVFDIPLDTLVQAEREYKKAG